MRIIAILQIAIALFMPGSDEETANPRTLNSYTEQSNS
jgi:hypothetical protein